MHTNLNLLDVPGDFPVAAGASGLAGAHEKYSATLNAGRYYVSGTSPQDRQAQFLACIELVLGYAAKCKRKAEKHPELTTEQVLEGYLTAARAAHVDVTIAQLEWVFRQVAQRLGWPERRTQAAASGQGGAEI